MPRDNPFEPMIKNIGNYVSGTLYAQGVIPPIGIVNYDGTALASPADTHLLAAKDPVIDEIAVGMTGNLIGENTVTGAPPLQLPNSAGYPLQWFEVALSPYQDLHGYDSPWPAGGGKNLLDYSTATISTNSVSFESCLQIEANQTYTFSYYGTDTVTVICYKHGTSTRIFTSGYVNTYTYTFEESESIDVTFYNSTGITSAENLFQIEKGSSSSSWSPYSNICPILGTDKVTVWTDSKYGGLVEWNQIFPTRTINYSGTGFTITSDNNGVVVVTVTTDGTSESNAHNHTAMSIPSSVNGHKCILLSGSPDVKVQLKATSTESDVVFTATAGYNNVAFMFNNLSVGTYNVYPMLCDLTAMFGAGNEPATVEEFRALFPLDYYAYDTGTQKTVDQVNGSSYTPVTITFDDTLYGGTYDAVTGTLTLTHKIIDLGTLNWTNGGSLKLFFSTGIREEIKPPASNADAYSYGYCVAFQFISYNAIGTNTSYKICVSALGSVGVNDGNQYASLDAFKTAMSGMHFCYELATPIIFHTDGHTITTPKGNAYTWATAEDGNVDRISVSYIRNE